MKLFKFRRCPKEGSTKDERKEEGRRLETERKGREKEEKGKEEEEEQEERMEKREREERVHMVRKEGDEFDSPKVEKPTLVRIILFPRFALVYRMIGEAIDCHFPAAGCIVLQYSTSLDALFLFLPFHFLLSPSLHFFFAHVIFLFFSPSKKDLPPSPQQRPSFPHCNCRLCCALALLFGR